MSLNTVETTQKHVLAVLERIKDDLKELKRLTADPETARCPACEEARQGAAKLLLTRRVLK